MGEFLGMADIVVTYYAANGMECLVPSDGSKRRFSRLFGLGYDDDSAFGCMLIIARLVSLRHGLARLYPKLEN